MYSVLYTIPSWTKSNDEQNAEPVQTNGKRRKQINSKFVLLKSNQV